MRLAAQLTPGTPVFIPTLLTSTEYTNVTGGQRVENVEQAGDVVVFVCGQGSRSTLVQAVRPSLSGISDGRRLTADNLKDLTFSGGVVQVIDSLLIPPTNVTETTTAFNLTAFEGALYASNQIGRFSDTPNVTIFAPANEAFQALGPAISNMTSDALATVLDYMLLPQTIYSTGLTNGTKFPTQQGESITVLQSGNNKYINSAQLLTTDILIANGVLHIIDNVLNPQGSSATPNLQLATQVAVFASASAVGTLPFTTAIPCTSSCPVTSTSSRSTSGTGGSITSSAAGNKGTSTSASESSTTHSSSSSKALGAEMARETSFGAAGLMVALGGVVLMV